MKGVLIEAKGGVTLFIINLVLKKVASVILTG
jgi:hypothetical protein